MNKRLYWGLLALIILLGTAFVFIMLHDRAEIRKLEEALAKVKEQEQHVPQQADAGNRPPREASAGHKWEWHGDHWHEMPTSAPDTRQDETVKPAAPSVVETKTYEGPLTYHEELLKTNPVKALRLQAEERGHWSAKWIPKFPPDDQEAAELSRDLYLITYYESTDDTTNPICLQALQNLNAYWKANDGKSRELAERSGTFTYKDMDPPSEEYKQFEKDLARDNDLARLQWSRVTKGIVINPERIASKTLLPK